MGKINQETVKKVHDYVSDILDHQLPKDCLFHSKAHTMDVLKNVELISNYVRLSVDEMNILRVSALFHDVGYIRTYDGHEMESAIIAKNFLQNESIDENIINQIISAIKATKVPQNPKDKLAEILCDADLMHLTYDNYFDQIEMMRMEWQFMGVAKMTINEFNMNSVKFFKSHHYHSVYGNEVLQKKKEKTLKLIKERIVD